MPMKKAMPGGKIVNKGKYKHGGKVKRKKLWTWWWCYGYHY